MKTPLCCINYLPKMMNGEAPISSSISQLSSSINSFIQHPSSNSHFPSPSIANCVCYPTTLSLSYRSHSLKPICCSSSPGSGENDNKTVLDAFFLGKALGEALSERIGSTVGEVLATIGRFQAEQQKQVLEFQEDVLERAKRAKDKAAREALEEQGQLIPNSSTRIAAEKNGTISSAPGSIGDENRSGLGSLPSIEIDE